jgi:hypothetical protein
MNEHGCEKAGRIRKELDVLIRIIDWLKRFMELFSRTSS